MALRSTSTGAPFSLRAASGVAMPASFASRLPECILVSSTAYAAPPIHHRPQRASACSGRSTLIQPRTPYEPATRPASSKSSGGFLGKLLDQALRRVGQLRPLALPVLHPLQVDAQRLAPLRRL